MRIRTKVSEDIDGALTSAKLEPGRSKPHSKHYGVKIHWFRSRIIPNNIRVDQTSTHLQQADMMTEGLRKDLFVSFRLKVSGW
jgi:hypothetical protein